MNIKFNRNGWHRKLQRFVLGLPNTEHFDIPNLCPYFWLTVFCILISPFVVLFKTLRGLKNVLHGLLKVKIWDRFVAAIDRSVERFIEVRYAEWIKNPDPETFVLKIETHNRYFKLWRKYQEKLGHEWYTKRFQLLKDFETIQKERRVALAIKATEKRNAKADRAQRQKEFALRMARYTQKAAPLLLTLLVGGIGYGVYWLFQTVTYDIMIGILNALMGLAIGAGLVLSLIYIGVLLVGFVRWCIDRLKDWRNDRTRTSIYKVYREKRRPIRNSLGFVWGKIKAAFVIFWVYGTAVLKDYCPGIEWEDSK